MNQKSTNNILPKLFGSSQIFVTPDSVDILKSGRGNNQKGIIVLYREEEDPELIQFLQRILEAAKLNIENDIWIKRITKGQRISWSNLKKNLEIHYLLSFGVQAKQLGLIVPFQNFQPTSAFNTTFLFAPQLSQLENDKPAKGQLWTALQTLFL